MTLADFRDELWQTSGEDTNLDPATVAGAARLDRWINRAYKRILFWRFPDGTQMRFPATDGLLYFQTKIVTGTIASATTTVVTLDSSAGSGDDQYIGWVGDFGGTKKIIVDYDGAGRGATVHDAFGTAPTGTYTLYKNFMRLSETGSVGADENIVLSPVSQVMAIKKITNVKRYWDLAPAERTDAFSITALSPAYPRQYARRGNDIVFDYPSLEAEWYRMEYVRNPPDLSAVTDVPEIPTYFDSAILLHATWSVLVWQQDNDEAYARKRDLQEFMMTVKQQGEMEYERENGQAEVLL